MRFAIIALVFGAAIVAWVLLMSNTDKVHMTERFTASDADKKNSYSSDIMDVYKELYGKYPMTEVLVHYRDAAVSGGLSLEEIKARIKMDGGKPPGLKVPSESAEKTIAEMTVTKSVESKRAIPGAQKPADVQDLAGKLMSLAMQMSALAEEVKASGAGSAKVPKGLESFIAF